MADPKSPADNKPAVRGPSEDTLTKFLELQTKELALRTRDYDLRQKEIDHGAKYAEKMLDAQVTDRKDERQHEHRQTIARYIGAGVIALAILGFSGWALYLNKDAIVMEALKLIGSAAIGFGGGYFYGKGRASSTTDPPSQPGE